MVNIVKNNNLDEARQAQYAVIDFSAKWCTPCNMLAPILEEVSEEYDNVQFYNADVEANGELPSEFKVINIPALFILKDGQVVARTEGFMPKDILKDFIDSNIQ